MKIITRKPNTSRIVITGIGVILSNTFSKDVFWQNLRNGASQIDFLRRFNTDERSVKVASEIRDFNYKQFLPNLQEHHAAKYGREILMTAAALEESRRDAGLRPDMCEPHRISFIEATSRGAIGWWHEMFEGHYRRVITSQGGFDNYEHAFDGNTLFPGLPSCAASIAAIYSNIRGFVTTINGACISGHQAIGLGVQEILCDNADVVFAGGHDFPLIPPIIQTYSSEKINVLSRESHNPKAAMKPYDVQRDGFAFGEGAIVLCLESLQHALSRGARIYAEVLGHSSINEASHPTRMDLSGTTTGNVIRHLVKRSSRSIHDISYFCGHGTATRYNDVAESRALQHVYGSVPRYRWAPMGSVKPIYGHCMGAAGAINVAASALMIHHQCLCPTINISQVDPECDHDHVSEGFRDVDVKLIVSIAFAIGSQTSVLTLGALA